MSISWDEAKDIIADGSVERLAKLERNESCLKCYREFRAQLLTEWASVTDYLICQLYLPFSRVSLQEYGKKRVTLDRTACKALGESSSKVQVWRINDFPYDFELGIIHYCLWSTVPLNEEEIQSEIEARFDPKQYDSLFFVNPPSLQSIRDLWHAHVMIRPRASSVG